MGEEGLWVDFTYLPAFLTFLWKSVARPLSPLKVTVLYDFSPSGSTESAGLTRVAGAGAGGKGFLSSQSRGARTFCFAEAFEAAPAFPHCVESEESRPTLLPQANRIYMCLCVCARVYVYIKRFIVKNRLRK